MREILFRGKMQISWSWFEGIYLPENKIIVSYFEIGKWDPSEDMMNCKCVFHKVIPSTVGQYTGLTDKNGVRIFEGDIVQAEDYRFVVKFGKSGGVKNDDHEVGYIGFYVIPVGKDAELFIETGLRTDILYWINARNVSIIGNIHDNPELLEAERNDENETH